MKPDEIANRIVSELQNGINSLCKTKFLSNEWFEKYSISGPKSKLHSRVLGIISRMNIDKGWVIDIERSLKGNGIRQFRPDAIGWFSPEKIGFVIEFESISSSDSRIEWKDLENYKKYINNNSEADGDGLPLIWVIISTLMSQPVEDEDWDSWDWKEQGEFYDEDNSEKLWNKLLKSPLNFWQKRFVKRFEETFKKTKNKCPICWINIDSGKVNIESLLIT